MTAWWKCLASSQSTNNDTNMILSIIIVVIIITLNSSKGIWIWEYFYRASWVHGILSLVQPRTEATRFLNSSSFYIKIVNCCATLKPPWNLSEVIFSLDCAWHKESNFIFLRKIVSLESVFVLWDLLWTSKWSYFWIGFEIDYLMLHSQ